MEKDTELEILLIEDNMNDAEMAIRALKKRNIANKILHLKDGAMAIQFLFGIGQYEGRDINNQPKVILLDLKMPKVTGMEVLQMIKGNPLTHKIPVVVLTSSKENPDVEKCYELGANSYIVKPVEFENFSKAVAEIGLYWILHNHSAL
jgi:two-component system response regulator